MSIKQNTVVAQIMLSKLRAVVAVFSCSVLLALCYVSSLENLFSAFEISKDEVVGNLLEKNLTTWTKSEVNIFMKLKESEYEERRSQVKKFCVEHQQQFSNGTRRMNLIYNGRDRIAYCAIPKVASSTWCWHFIQLGKADFYN